MEYVVVQVLEERAQLLPSGRQTVFANRAHWAKTYLTKAGLLEATRWAHFRITDRGRRVLQSKPEGIDKEFLTQFPEFNEFLAKRKGPGEAAVEETVTQLGLQAATPDEIIRKAHKDINTALGQDLARSNHERNAPIF